MVDFSTLNPFRQGQSSLTDARQPIATSGSQADQNAGKTGGNPTPVVDPVDLSEDAVAARNADKNPLQAAGSKSLKSEPMTTDELFAKALDAALELIKDDMVEMFKLAGMDDKEALAATNAMFKGIREMAADDGQIDFSFQQAIASHSRTEISYAGANGAGVGVSESAMMAMQSLDININSDTGEFSFNYEASKIQVVRTEAVAIGNSMGAAMGALGTVMNGLGGGNLVDMLGNPAGAGNGGLLFDMEGSGVADFIRDLMLDTTGAAPAAEGKENADGTTEDASMQEILASRMAKLNAQIMEQATLVVRGVTETMAEDGSGDPMLKLSVDMLMPMGRFGQDENGATFQLPNGETVSVIDPSQEQDVLA
ncbi:MAG: hypothetical protein JKY47_19660 [Thalassospira sp.]|jgi:hypothetical protein|uniref:hypothetical protein n=1 Tax=Thalassospira sp. 11-3 TaxID=2135614 RepID=UPI000D76F0E0|nr:hypothetical protein [Thalassospira sp. 11-3]MBL4843036.1 hypothetical protein [Thalassospira sp.]PXX34426.1 hypothetical protein C7967_102485 [Thalassospira sp. 11-3]